MNKRLIEQAHALADNQTLADAGDGNESARYVLVGEVPADKLPILVTQALAVPAELWLLCDALQIVAERPGESTRALVAAQAAGAILSEVTEYLAVARAHRLTTTLLLAGGCTKSTSEPLCRLLQAADVDLALVNAR